MKWQQKWLVAIIVTIAILGMAKLEDHRILNTQITKAIRSGEDFVTLRKWTYELLNISQKEEVETIPVTADPTPSPLAAYYSMQPFKTGVLVSYEDPLEITAKENGFITFTGHTRETGKTVTILYENGDEVTYGLVKSFSKLPYSTVAQGESIAEMGTGAMFLKVSRDGEDLSSTSITDWLLELSE